jgi:hypothetical protein
MDNSIKLKSLNKLPPKAIASIIQAYTRGADSDVKKLILNRIVNCQGIDDSQMMKTITEIAVSSISNIKVKELVARESLPHTDKLQILTFTNEYEVAFDAAMADSITQ